MSRVLVTILCAAAGSALLGGCTGATRAGAAPVEGAPRSSSATTPATKTPHIGPDESARIASAADSASAGTSGAPSAGIVDPQGAQPANTPFGAQDLSGADLTGRDLPRRDLALPRGWDTLPIAAFEEALAPWNPEGTPARLSQAALDQLAHALDGATPLALRAVLLLAASAAPEACDVLAARLDRRLRSASGAFPAVDVAAAAALGRDIVGVPAAKRADNLYELAVGRRPHPLLPVRVECAASSLALGRANATKLLLAVLREGTPAQSERPSYARAGVLLEDLALAQWRAADALTRFAGIPNEYLPEQSAFERERIADEIERALAARGRDDSAGGLPARTSKSAGGQPARASESAGGQPPRTSNGGT